jgi:uncharacterized small protein (DUF1192 family)
MAFMVLRRQYFPLHTSQSGRREESEAMDSDDLEPRKKKLPAIVPGEDISALSAHELEQRIARLQEEVSRCRDAIKARGATRDAAENFFKR